MSRKKDKILVAMSGGVDSSVAAALLVKAGYDVTGAFMVNYEGEITQINGEDYADSSPRLGGEGLQARGGLAGVSCWQADYQDALRVAAKLGIKLLRFDFTKEYKKMVLDYMYKEYEAGRTPNPDVLCNKFIKFGVWLDKARKMGFDYLATGHYARLGREIPNPKSQIPIKLLQAKDENKDQTYFLHQLTQEQLKYVMFPIGEYLKSEVRDLARHLGLPTAEKEESMGICFVGEVPMKEFLMKKIKLKKGKIILSPSASATPPEPPLGKRGIPVEIGEHDGLAFYTIGERIGLSPSAREGVGGVGVSTSATPPTPPLGKRRKSDTLPLFVIGKNLKTNELVVGYEDDPLLYKKQIEMKDVNWISGTAPKFPLKCEARLRHRQPLQKCVVESPLGRGRGGLAVYFSIPQRAATPGQFAVFYKNGECLGGGVIAEGRCLC